MVFGDVVVQALRSLRHRDDETQLQERLQRRCRPIRLIGERAAMGRYLERRAGEELVFWAATSAFRAGRSGEHR